MSTPLLLSTLRRLLPGEWILNVVGCTVGGFLLYDIAGRTGIDHATVFVHIAEPGCVATIDGDPVDAEPLGRPASLDLPPGHHILRLEREGTLLYEEPFHVRRREQRVLTAYDDRNPTR